MYSFIVLICAQMDCVSVILSAGYIDIAVGGDK